MTVLNVLNVKWPIKVSNERVYKITKLKPWSQKIQKQRLTTSVNLVATQTSSQTRCKYGLIITTKVEALDKLKL